MSAISLRRFFTGSLSILTVAVALRAHAAVPEAGKILLSKGQVLILDKNSKVVADPEGKRGRKTGIGATFFEGETIQTAADGRVKISFVQGGNEVVLGGNTALFIEKATPKPQGPAGTKLSLARGEIRSDVKKKYSGEGEDTYEIHTKNAVAGVRGTIFIAKFDPKSNSSQFATQRGLVAVSAVALPSKPGAPPPKPVAPVLVAAGSYTSSVGSAPPIPARPTSSNPELSKSIQKLEGSSESSGDSSSDGSTSKSAPGEKSKGTASGDGSKDSAKDSKSAPSTTAANGDSSGKSESSGGGDVPLGREPVTKNEDGTRTPASSSSGSSASGQLMGDTAKAKTIAPSVPNFSTIQNNTTELINRVNQTRQTETIRSDKGDVVIKIE